MTILDCVASTSQIAVDEESAQTSQRSPYFIDGPLRKVHPYNHTYLTYSKERWRGRTLLEIFTTEFRDRSKDFYEWAISSGTVLVNGNVVDCSYIVRNGDLISNVVHRHEPPIIGGPIKIFQQDDERGIWAVEKKASMPIHSTGRYRYNTLLEVLKHEHGLDIVSTGNRLDRLVSGVILIATRKSAAQALGKDFSTPGRVKKEYVARVTGKFPAYMASSTPEPDADAQEGEVICAEPLLTIDKQMGVNVVHPDGRPSKTVFKRISYCARTNTSIVRCRPITGRSHQLRVHLQFLGHPIANDPIYNSTLAWGESRGKGGIFHGLKARQHPLQPSFGRSSSHDLSISVADGVPKSINSDTTFVQKEQEASHEPNGLSSSETYAQKRAQRCQAVEERIEKRRAILDPLGGGSETDLNADAVRAITELRKTRDEEDNYARVKDMARPPLPVSSGPHTLSSDPPRGPNDAPSAKGQGPSLSAKRGVQMLSKAQREVLAHQHALPPPPEAEDDPLWYVAEDANGVYCKACGIPLLPDPTVEQLEIWLHAIRYYTDEWDYSSPLPDWARSDTVPETSALRL